MLPNNDPCVSASLLSHFTPIGWDHSNCFVDLIVSWCLVSGSMSCLLSFLGHYLYSWNVQEVSVWWAKEKIDYRLIEWPINLTPEHGENMRTPHRKAPSWTFFLWCSSADHCTTWDFIILCFFIYFFKDFSEEGFTTSNKNSLQNPKKNLKVETPWHSCKNVLL